LRPEVTEFDYKNDGGICYDKNGVTVSHWRRAHTMDGASGYRLDWNGLSFVWTGDGKPDQLTAKFAMGADVFVTEMVVDSPALWALRQGNSHSRRRLHRRQRPLAGLRRQVDPRLTMATHFSFDLELLGEAVAEVRTN
jgi:ribonuclease Z